MPAEHGAWGIIAVPFMCAAVLAGRTHSDLIPLLLAAVCVLGVFLLRGSLERHGSWRALRLPAHLALAAASGTCAAVLIFLYERSELIVIGVAALLLYLVQQTLVREHFRGSEKRSLATELVGVLLLTLSAPAATVAARGSLDAAGVRVWLLNALFFLGGVLYVKYRVRGLLAHQRFASLAERIVFAWPVFVYHLLLLLFLLTFSLRDSLPAMVLLAFAPAVLRAHGLLFQLGRRFPIKRLGWSEVAHSVVFAILLILASRV